MTAPPRLAAESRLAVLGYGIEGKSTVRYFLRHGAAHLEVRDAKRPDTLPAGVTARHGKGYLDALSDFDAIFRSPGVPLDLPELQIPVVRERLTSQYRYFLPHCPAFAVGVSGTKGKGTTATLLARMFERAGATTPLLGNVGAAMLDALDDIEADHRVVLELSSFQLEDALQSPPGAVLLRTSIDHLDRHGTASAYWAAKANLARHQKREDWHIVNRDCPNACAIAEAFPSRRFEVSSQAKVERGAFCDGERLWLALEGPARPVLSLSDLALPGAHNVENVLAAMLAAALCGVADQALRDAARGFRGLKHRLESLGEVEGRRFIDDSISTTPETAIAALRAFPEGTVIILLGGSDKGADFTGLAREVARRRARALCMGDTGPRIAESLVKAGAMCELISPGHDPTNGFDLAFRHAWAISREHDTILLSPACASFDMFTDYRERAARFRALRDSLAQRFRERGDD